MSGGVEGGVIDATAGFGGVWGSLRRFLSPAEKSVRVCLSSPRGTQRVADRLWRRNQQQPAQSPASSDRRDDGLLKMQRETKSAPSLKWSGVSREWKQAEDVHIRPMGTVQAERWGQASPDNLRKEKMYCENYNKWFYLPWSLHFKCISV